MSDTKDPLDLEHVRASIRQMDANIEAMRDSRRQWEAEQHVREQEQRLREADLRLRERAHEREERRPYWYRHFVVAAIVAASATVGALLARALGG